MNPFKMFSHSGLGRKAAQAFIGLGSNLGDSRALMHSALKKLEEAEGIHVDDVSTFSVTPPLTGSEQPDYLNAVASVRTTLTAEQLFSRMMMIEQSLGRVKSSIRWAPRTIDLDLLLFDDLTMETANLTLPHPQMHLRSFVLNAMCELAPDLQHPVLKRTIKELRDRLNGRDFFIEQDQCRLISVAGIIGAGKTTLANALSDCLGWRMIAEAYDTNPYLPRVYGGEAEFALDSQLYFLKSRVEQLKRSELHPREFAVSDYIFEKEMIYARLLLNSEQLADYTPQYEQLSGKISPPTLVIYLDVPPDKCLDRIHLRNRPYEQKIKKDLLENLYQAYNDLFKDWHQCPVIRIYGYEYDFREPEDMERLASEVVAYL